MPATNERSAAPGSEVKASPPTKSPMNRITGENVASSSASPSSLSFAARKAQLSRPPKPSIVEGNNVLRSIDRPPPGDVTKRRKAIQPGLAKRKSAYFENEFSAGREIDTTKDRVRSEAIVMAELRTNVIIQDEFTFLTDLSYQLSIRYQRSVSSIVIDIQHGCCMMFGGSFDPAYTLTIFALPTLIQPTMNKRNAVLIQNSVQESLGVAPSRGYVRFVATAEEDVANGGKTVAGEMDELEKDTDEGAHTGAEPSKVSRTKRMLGGSSALNNIRQMPPATEESFQNPSILPAIADETPLDINTIQECPRTPPEKEDPAPEKRGKIAVRRKSFGFGALMSSMGSTKDRRPKSSPRVEG